MERLCLKKVKANILSGLNYVVFLEVMEELSVKVPHVWVCADSRAVASAQIGHSPIEI